MRFRLLALVALVLLAGCTGGDDEVLPEGPSTLEVTSQAFEAGATIPVEYTCDGADVSPHLAVDNVPDGAGSLALLVSDPDAPSGSFDHWVAWNRPVDATTFPRNASGPGFQGQEGVNGFGDEGYGGPCPPEGEEHRYVFRAYAVTGNLSLEDDANGDDLRKALKDRVLAQGTHMGLYGR